MALSVVVALVFGPASMSFAAMTDLGDGQLPCHMTQMADDTGLAMTSCDDASHSGSGKAAPCPMMNGALCQAMVGMLAPAEGGFLYAPSASLAVQPARTDAPPSWAASPPHRPPKTI